MRVSQFVKLRAYAGLGACCAGVLFLVLASPGAACAAEQTVFVEGGQPKLIRPVGRKWRFEKDYIEFWDGPRSLLYAGREIGEGDFHLTAKLAVTQDEAVPSFVVGLNKDGQLAGFRRKGIAYVRGPVSRHLHLLIPRDRISNGQPFTFEAVRRGPKLVFKIDGKPFHEASYQGERFGTVGFTAFERQCALRVYEFSVIGHTRSLGNWTRTQPWRHTLPEIDISGEKDRQVVLMRGTKDVDYEHPSTLLMPDGKTMFTVWALEHGGAGGSMKKSTDGGKTWGELLPTPDNWKKTHNCPTIHRVVGPDGTERLFVFALLRGGMCQSVSLDRGTTWSEMKINGLACTVPPIRVVPIEGGKRHLILYHREPNTYQSISADGGLSWGKETTVAARYDVMPCEPDVVRSPYNSRQLTAIMREQWRACNSMLITSDDEGKTWKNLREGSIEVTGDRHLGRYAPDGRLVIVFRDNSLDTPVKLIAKGIESGGRFVAWVGTYEDLANGHGGQYRILLLTSHFGCGYPGLEVLPDGTFVATTYTALEPGELHSIVSVRFKLDEMDERLKKMRN